MKFFYYVGKYYNVAHISSVEFMIGGETVSLDCAKAVVVTMTSGEAFVMTNKDSVEQMKELVFHGLLEVV